MPLASFAPAAVSGHAADTLAAAIVIGLCVAALLAVLLRRALSARRHQEAAEAPPAPARGRFGRWVPGAVALFGLAALAVVLLAGGRRASPGQPNATGQPGGRAASPQLAALRTNPHLDPGTPLSRAAPDFTLRNQFGRRVSLHQFRGKVVLLAFNDSECTTICPLTTTAMIDAKAMLGPAASHVALLGVDANPDATSIRDVAGYSQTHGMTHAWDFLTGSLAQLKRVWHDYSVASDIIHGQIDHTPALFVISPQGREAKLYMTQQSYAAVDQLAQLVAVEASQLLPGHPKVHSDLSYAQAPTISPGQTVNVPRPEGGTLTFGPGRPHLYLFFATWDRQVTDLAAHLAALNAYAAAAGAGQLPALTAVDEGSVEPSAHAARSFLHGLRRPLAYPVGVDTSGRIADGYGVQDEPWLVLTSAAGQVVWYQDVSTSGWPSNAELIGHVRAALKRPPAAPQGSTAVAQELAGSPPPLAALHRQASQLLGNEPALADRLKALRGYPVVLNVWASWCGPCQSEFKLFASASARYGRRVAFLGADANDSASSAEPFLRQHPVSYPSYTTSIQGLDWLAPVGNLPTTVFISPQGRVAHVQIGQYEDQGALDGDIGLYALHQG